MRFFPRYFNFQAMVHNMQSRKILGINMWVHESHKWILSSDRDLPSSCSGTIFVKMAPHHDLHCLAKSDKLLQPLTRLHKQLQTETGFLISESYQGPDSPWNWTKMFPLRLKSRGNDILLPHRTLEGSWWLLHCPRTFAQNMESSKYLLTVWMFLSVFNFLPLKKKNILKIRLLSRYLELFPDIPIDSV